VIRQFLVICLTVFATFNLYAESLTDAVSTDLVAESTTATPQGADLPSEMGYRMPKAGRYPTKHYNGRPFKASLTKTPDFQVVRFSGRLGLFTNTSNLVHLAENLDPDKPIYLHVPKSPGGFEMSFKKFINDLKGRRPHRRKVTMITSGQCNSSCSHISAMADRSIGVKSQSSFGVHRLSLFNLRFKLRSRKMEARSYGRNGASKSWFMKNRRRVFRYNNKIFKLSEKESLESGLVDRYVESSEVDDLLSLIEESA